MLRMLSVVAIVGIACSMCVFAEEKYPDKYDDIDVRAIVANDRLRNQHRKCYMNLGPCPTADMKFFKEYIPEALITKCKKCTEKQKENFSLLTEWYVTNKPDEWDEFVRKIINDLRKKYGGQ